MNLQRIQMEPLLWVSSGRTVMGCVIWQVMFRSGQAVYGTHPIATAFYAVASGTYPPPSVLSRKGPITTRATRASAMVFVRVAEFSLRMDLP